MALQVVTPPTDPSLITLVQAKAQLRLDASYTDDDEDIAALILAASALIEDQVARRYTTQTVAWIREMWHDRMVLPLTGAVDGQQISVGGIQYVDLNGETQTLDPSLYWVRPYGKGMMIVRRWFVVWPWLGDGAERVKITFTIDAPDAVPAKIQHACKLLVSHWYQNRDAVVGVESRDSSTELPLGVQRLLVTELWS